MKTNESSTLHNNFMWSSQENLQEKIGGANSMPTLNPQGAHKLNIVQSSPEEFDAVAGAEHNNVLNFKNNNVVYDNFIWHYSHMIKHKVRDYILLSKVIEYLRWADSTYTKASFNININHLYDYCVNSWFVVTKEKLEENFVEIINYIDTIEWDNIDDIASQHIVKAITESDEILTLESKTKLLFEVYNWRFDCKELIENPHKMITVDNINYMEKLTFVWQDDFRNACLCIAYWLWTSAWFHLSRLIEEISYNYAIILWIKDAKWYDDDWRKIYHNMWMIIQAIKKKNTHKKYKALFVSEIDSIRDLVRNETQHPDKIYTQAEAEWLFMRTIAIVTSIEFTK